MPGKRPTYGIVGLGLIGGSLARDLSRKGQAGLVLGHDANPAHQERAAQLHIVDRTGSLDEVVKESDIIVLAIPVDAIGRVLPRVLDSIQPHQVVVEVGSTKVKLLEHIAGHRNRRQLVSAHPMAGTEYTGPDAAVYHLFDKKCCVICEADKSEREKVEFVKHMFEGIGMYVIGMDKQEHDLHAAYVSHISHVTSFALAQTVLEKEKDEARIFEMASGGFSSTVRLAKSAPSMWAPIFMQNKENVLDVLNAHIAQLTYFKHCLEKEDSHALHAWMEKANEIRKIIK